MTLPETVKKYLERFYKNGFKAYVVGGAVRDKLCGIEPIDYDVTTNAKTEDVKRIFHDCNVYDTGVKHGTVSVLFEGKIYETTTFRVDGEYHDNRHPDSVAYTDDLVTDLSRRDFTMNAIAVGLNGEIVDPFGGKNDIKSKIVKAVGDPVRRFNEDALRIMRALRFSAQTGFEIEENTKKALFECKDLLSNVSVERIFEEFTKLLVSCGSFAVLIDYKEIIFGIIPELKPCDGFDQLSLSHFCDVYEHTAHVVRLVSDRKPITVWAALLHDIGKPETLVVDKYGYGHFPKHMKVSANIADKILNRFKVSNDFRQRVVTLVKYHDEPFDGGKYEIKQFLNEYDESLLEDLITLKFADIYAHSEHGIEKYLPERVVLKNLFAEIKANNECYKLNDICIDGNDITALGFSGRMVGEILAAVLDGVISDKIENEKEALLSFVKERFVKDRYIICIGGGELKDKTTLPIDKYIADLAKKHAGEKRARALFIGTASHDYMPYFNTFRKTYTGEFDIKADCLLTVYTTYERAKIEEKFRLCDMIYVGGGDTVFMLEKWKENGITDLIFDAYKRGVVISGLSAGAICWFENMYTDSDSVSRDGKYSFHKGLGKLQGTCSPHFDDRKEDLLPSMKAENVGECFAIENDAALVFENEKLIGSLSSGGNAYLIRNNVGDAETYIIERITE